MRHFQGIFNHGGQWLRYIPCCKWLFFMMRELANLLHQTIDLLEFHFQFFIVWNKWLETPKFFKVEVNWPSFVSFESCSTCHQSSVNFHHHHQSFRAGSEDNQGALLHLTDTDEWVENWAIVATMWRDRIEFFSDFCLFITKKWLVNQMTNQPEFQTLPLCFDDEPTLLHKIEGKTSPNWLIYLIFGYFS